MFVVRFVFVFVVCCVKTGHAYIFLFVSVREVDVSVLFGGFGYYALGRQLFSRNVLSVDWCISRCVVITCFTSLLLVYYQPMTSQ